MPAYICLTCATQFAPAVEPPGRCPICEDERQYVGSGGQQWRTPEEMGRSHHQRVEAVEPGLVGVGVHPHFAIGQRALLVERERLLWDCVPLLDGKFAQYLEARGGIETIAISHPHFHAAMIDWAERFDARVLLHASDREWIMRPDPRIELWSGEELTLSDSLTLVRLGGHFPGATVCLWRDGAEGRGALLSSDIVAVVQDRDWASFMWSFPNLIPLAREEVERIGGVLARLDFDRVYGGWWDSVMREGAGEKVRRSAERYVRALAASD